MVKVLHIFYNNSTNSNLILLYKPTTAVDHSSQLLSQFIEQLLLIDNGKSTFHIYF